MDKGLPGRRRAPQPPGLELNPDEWVWKNIKHDRIGKIGVTTKDDLKTKATNAPTQTTETALHTFPLPCPSAIWP